MFEISFSTKTPVGSIAFSASTPELTALTFVHVGVLMIGAAICLGGFLSGGVVGAAWGLITMVGVVGFAVLLWGSLR